MGGAHTYANLNMINWDVRMQGRAEQKAEERRFCLGIAWASLGYCLTMGKRLGVAWVLLGSCLPIWYNLGIAWVLLDYWVSLGYCLGTA